MLELTPTGLMQPKLSCLDVFSIQPLLIISVLVVKVVIGVVTAVLEV